MYILTTCGRKIVDKATKEKLKKKASVRWLVKVEWHK